MQNIQGLKIITNNLEATQYAYYQVIIQRFIRVNSRDEWQILFEKDYTTYYQAKAKYDRVKLESKIEPKCEKYFVCIYILGYDKSNNMWFTIEERSIERGQY